MVINFPEIKIADAINVNPSDVIFSADDYFVGQSCTVEVNGVALDCFFGNGNIESVIESVSGKLVWSK